MKISRYLEKLMGESLVSCFFDSRCVYGIVKKTWANENHAQNHAGSSFLSLASTPPGMPGTQSSPPIFWLGGREREYPPIVLRTFGYRPSRPILVALRSLSLKPISFGYKTPPIRFSQACGQSAHKARPPNLELALTPLLSFKNRFQCFKSAEISVCAPTAA